MKILVGYDGSADADAALQDLERAGLPGNARALIVTQSAPWVPLQAEGTPLLGGKAAYPETAEESRREALAVAEKAAARLRARRPGWTVEALGGLLDPAIGILEAAAQWSPDLIVVGSHGKGALARLFLGSVSQKILHHAATDVRITRPSASGHPGPAKHLIGLDGSSGSLDAAAAVSARTWPEGTRVRLISVFNGIPESVPGVPPEDCRKELGARSRQALDERLAKAAFGLTEAGLDVDSVVRSGDPREMILKEAMAWGATTVWMGCRGLGALDRFLIGSVSSMVAVHAPCTVEVVRRRRKNPG